MSQTSAPNDAIEEFLNKLPTSIQQEILGNDSDASKNHRRLLNQKGGEALRILKAKKATLAKTDRPIIRAGLVVDFLCRQGEICRSTCIPVAILSAVLGVKNKKNIEQMQALVSSHLTSSLQKKSNYRRGEKRKLNDASARGSTGPSSSQYPPKKAMSQPTDLISDLCIRLGPLIPNIELASSYARTLFHTLTNISNTLLMDDISRNVEYYEAVCLFLAVQRMEGSDDPKSKQLARKASKKSKPECNKEDGIEENDGEEDIIDEDQTLCETDIVTSANLREGMFSQVLQCVNKYIRGVDIPKHASLCTIAEPVVDVPKQSKRRVVSEKYSKWKHDTLKSACNQEDESSSSHDRDLLQIAADEVLQKFSIT